ncbi:hypothetical protein [Nonomuraea sp. KM90]|uniref:hypothetical protein n=1 Tax=Nonomuraea sp. KM90 TaxID=3457428 RepID=UPI003FCE9213
MATENSGPHLPSSWPEAPRRDAAPSWPDSPPAEVPTSWPESPRPAQPEPSWPEPPRKDTSWPEPPGASRTGPAGPSSWPDAPAQGPSWPDAPRQNGGRPEGSPHDVPIAWPDAPPQSTGPAPWQDASAHSTGPAPWQDASAPGAAGPAPWQDASSPGLPAPPPGQPVVPDPVPAWAQPPTPSPGAWSNLSSPAPWPQAERAAAADPSAEHTMMYDSLNAPAGNLSPPQAAPHTGPHTAPPAAPPQDGPSGPQPPPQGHPAEERTVTYAQHSENLLNDRAVPSTPMDSAHVGAPPGEDQSGRPGSNLSRDPSDPEHRFVTAGQISGSRTPPPERQQELWNTVFGDNYQSMGEQDSLDDDEPGKPIWIYALGGSVAIALVAALLWAFLWGPLAGEKPSSANVAGGKATASQEPKTTKTSTSIGPLPKYSGRAAPVIGRVPVAAAGVSIPRLGGTWQLDQRATVKGTYGFDSRQYVQVAPEKYAELLVGPLSPRLASYYEQDNLEPVIKQVVLSARKRFFPPDNKVRKIAQQPIKVNGQTGRLIAYSLTSETEKATIVTMAVNTGANVPAIVYMSIPSDSKQLLPDIRTVMNQMRLAGQS